MVWQCVFREQDPSDPQPDHELEGCCDSHDCIFYKYGECTINGGCSQNRLEPRHSSSEDWPSVAARYYKIVGRYSFLIHRKI